MSSINTFPKLHNAAWPGVVGKGSPGAEPPIEFDTMLTPDKPLVPLRSAAHCRKRHEGPNAPESHQVGSSSILSKRTFGISIRRPILMLGI